MTNGIFGKGRLVFLDGGMGTQLQDRGLKPGETPELWNLSRPGDIRAVHSAYLAAGADVVWGSHPHVLQGMEIAAETGKIYEPQSRFEMKGLAPGYYSSMFNGAMRGDAEASLMD